MTAGSNDPNFINAFSLFEFYFQATRYLTDADRYVFWNSNSYAPVGLSHEAPSKDKEPQGNVLRLGLSNVDRSVAAMVLGEAPQGKRVVMRRAVWTAPGSFSAPSIVFDGKIDAVSIAEEGEEDEVKASVSMEVRNDFALWEKSLPRTMCSATCNWVFKSTTPGCQYTGVATVCDRTWDRCAELSNTDRFRGFRHLPTIEDKEIWWGRKQA